MPIGPWGELEKGKIAVAVERAPHVKALDVDAVQHAWSEKEQKQKKGYCTIMKWKDIKDKHPPQLKISPIAAMPHKYRPFRIIQNLYNEIKINNVNTPSVNQITVRIDPEEALHHIGK